MINFLFESQYPMEEFLLQHKKYFSFLLIKATSSFFSFGLQLDGGFDTNSFIDKVKFNEFFQVCKLIGSLIGIERYQVQLNMISNYISKLIKVFLKDKTMRDKKINKGVVLHCNLTILEKHLILITIVNLYNRYKKKLVELSTQIE